jgi:hypothetical protein
MQGSRFRKRHWSVIGLLGLLLMIAGLSQAAALLAADAPPGAHASARSPNDPTLRFFFPAVVAAPYINAPDLGDAPDSSNSHGAGMTAYPLGGPPGVAARFPTVHIAGSPPHGPLHYNQRVRYLLGWAITAEKEADIGFDADGVNNLLPSADTPDRDRADDGVTDPLLPHCQPTTVTYVVTVPPGAPASKAYVNLWFDWDRSGFWGGTLPCAGAAAPEWAVQNQVLALPGPGVYSFTTPAFLPYNPRPDECLWWRITLASAPATAADGSGPAGGYEFGETEDYYRCGEHPRTPTPTPTATRTCVAPPFEMTAWWPLDETTGTTAADIAGFPTNGVHFNGPVPVAGMVNAGLSFDGVDDYVEVADHPSLNFGQGNLSIDAWIRTNDTAGVKVILDKRLEGTTVQGYSLFLGNGNLAFQLANGVGSTTCSTNPSSACTNYGTSAFVADGQWHHIAVTVDRMNPIGGRFYVDGALVAVFDPTIRIGSLTNPNPLRLASRSSSVSGLLRGSLDEVELFPRVLTPAEVQSIYQANRFGKCRTTPTPTATASPTRTPTPTRTRTPTPTKVPPSIIVVKLEWPFMQPLPGWPMTLFAGPDCAGAALRQMTTNEHGWLDFTDLTPGVYSVREEMRPGYESILPQCQTVDLSDAVGNEIHASSVAYPPAGEDTFPSGALLTAEIFGVGSFDVVLNGPTTVRRGDPADEDGDGLTDIRTEILAMELTGMSPVGPITLRQSREQPSRGRVEQLDPATPFPADSFFDVFVELDTAAGPLHNATPVHMQTAINAIPPIMAFYQSPPTAEIPLLNANGQPVGRIRYALHIPLPPKEKIIIFINHKPATRTPTPTRTRSATASPTGTPTATRTPFIDRTATPTATRSATASPTGTPTATRTPTLTPTRTPTRTATPRVTPTPTATQKPVLTGVSSTFFEVSPGVYQITVHVVTDDLHGIVFDLEIFFADQSPPWTGGQPLQAPPGWFPMQMSGGIGWVTEANPLQKCQPVHFVIQTPADTKVGDFISIHLTDRNHRNLGNITSQRVARPGVIATEELAALCAADAGS